MANKKQPYSWSKVLPGDIISFIIQIKIYWNNLVLILWLVLNPKLNVTLKDGKSTKQLIGIKIEESNKALLTLTKKQIKLFEQIGNLIPIRFKK